MQFPRKTISASLINSYYDCPLQWKLINIDGLQPKMGEALEIGSIFDLMVKEFHSGRDPYENAQKKFLGLRPSKQQINNFGLCRKLMEVYAKNPYPFTHAQFDVRFKLALSHPETGKTIEYPLTGFLDGLDTIIGGVRVVEYKTSGKDYTQEQIDTAVQADIYGYYAYRQSGEDKIDIDYVVANKSKKTFQLLHTYRTKEHFINLFDKVEKFIDDVRQEKFEQNPNHPFWCQCKTL